MPLVSESLPWPHESLLLYLVPEQRTAALSPTHRSSPSLSLKTKELAGPGAIPFVHSLMSSFTKHWSFLLITLVRLDAVPGTQQVHNVCWTKWDEVKWRNRLMNPMDHAPAGGGQREGPQWGNRAGSPPVPRTSPKSFNYPIFPRVNPLQLILPPVQIHQLPSDKHWSFHTSPLTGSPKQHANSSRSLPSFLLSAMSFLHSI